MRIVMVGTGYVGLVSGACLADFGHQLTCIDKDAARIANLNSGQIPFYEPGLEPIVHANVRQKRLSFSTDLQAFVPEADAIFIAVETPSRNNDVHADITHVYQAAREIAPRLTGFHGHCNKVYRSGRNRGRGRKIDYRQ